MATRVDEFAFAADIREGFIIETRNKVESGPGDPSTSDWMVVEEIIVDEFGIRFYGKELMSGRRLFTCPVPPSALITGWAQ